MVKAIDLERGGRSTDQLAEALIKELFHGGTELEVGLHEDGRRTRLETFSSDVRQTAMPVNHRSVIVVTGGARGVTSAALIALAHENAPRMLLLGRTSLASEHLCCKGARTDAEIKKALLESTESQGRNVSPVELGELATVIISLEQKENVLWLPPEAVRSFQGRDFVVIQDGDVQRRVVVRLGLET